MKYLRTVVVMALIFILPAGSWWYLQSGYNYRKAALGILSPKDSLSNTSLNILMHGKDFKDQLKGKTTCLALIDDAAFQTKYFDQYRKALSFQMIVGGDSLAIKGLDKAAYVLIDTSGYIRNTYGETREEQTKLIEHTAIILPRKIQKDVKFKENQD